MKQFSVRNLFLLVVVVAQPFITSGCMEKFRAADKQVETMDKRMKQTEKDASNVPSKTDSGSK
jgi:hypothetical protein